MPESSDDVGERLDPAALRLWRIEGALWLAGLAIGLAIAEVVVRAGVGGVPGWPGLPAVALLAVGGPLLWRITAAAHRRWRIVLGDDAIELRHGFVTHRRSLIPWYRVQHIDTGAGPIARSLDLAHLTVHTASAATDASIPGLRTARAEQLRREVLERTGIRDGV